MKRLQKTIVQHGLLESVDVGVLWNEFLDLALGHGIRFERAGEGDGGDGRALDSALHLALNLT